MFSVKRNLRPLGPLVSTSPPRIQTWKRPSSAKALRSLLSTSFFGSKDANLAVVLFFRFYHPLKRTAKVYLETWWFWNWLSFWVARYSQFSEVERTVCSWEGFEKLLDDENLETTKRIRKKSMASLRNMMVGKGSFPFGGAPILFSGTSS